MSIDRQDLAQLCLQTLAETDFKGLGRRIVGKVRDSYVGASPGERTIVVSDRVSCFDVVVGTIPLKGQVLNQMAAFWFDQTREIARNHLRSVPDPNVSIVQECRTLPVEFVMRGYLTGSTSTSIWSAYARGERDYCGHRLPDGMARHEPLAAALLTPTTKAPRGQHDELTSRDEILRGGELSEETYDECARITAALFAEGQRWAESRGLILVDTKYELGLGPDGKIVVIDEIHTPDSSRYWFREDYAMCIKHGIAPKSLDKDIVRFWLREKGFKGEGEIPQLTPEIRIRASKAYIEAYEIITGKEFVPGEV